MTHTTPDYLSKFIIHLVYRGGARAGRVQKWQCKVFSNKSISYKFLNFSPKFDLNGAISQKSTVHLHHLHPPYAAPETVQVKGSLSLMLRNQTGVE